MASNPRDPNFAGRRVDWSHTAFETRAIRAGQDPDRETGSVIVPIYQTSTFRHEAVGQFNGYEYSRTDNPTRTALQASLASLEGGAWGLAFASGTAATREIATLLNPGDHILMSNDAYGGTFRLFDAVFGRFGVEVSIADLSCLDLARSAVRPNTRMIWAETPTNPAMRITDIAGMAEIARSAGAMLVVDNTFATPYLQTPLDLGADIVMHSLTKYMAGHSDVVMGAVVVKDDELHEKLAFIQNACGGTPGPQDCFLVLRGIKTLHIRMERHCENGRAVAQYLKNHDKVEKVFWPGLEDHPSHYVAKEQMRSYGGMVSFVLKGDRMEDAIAALERFKYFALAESLGGVESLCGHPASMTHASIPGAERLKAGLSDSLIRLSVGIEDIEDLLADLEQAIG